MVTKKEAVKLALIHQDIEYIKKKLDGNGEEGLIRATRKNTNFRVGHEAKEKQFKLLMGSGYALIIALFIISLFV